MGISTVSRGPANFAALAATGEAQEQRAKDLKTQSVDSEKQIEKAASGFEALLLHQMMSSMWETVEWSGMFGGSSNASEIYRDMFTQAVSDSISAGRGIGVKEVVTRELRKKEPSERS